MGFVGLGKMGGAMIGRLHAGGHSVVGFDLSPDARHRAAAAGVAVASSLDDLCAAMETPCLVWLMTPPGEATESAVAALADRLRSGDILVDGGNSDFRDSLRRGRALGPRGIVYVDVGVSGGVQGARTGCGLLVGATSEIYAHIAPVLLTLAAPGACVRVGTMGAGHLAKAVHNGVEYALMQAYGEGYEILSASDLDVDVIATLSAWQAGCSVRSYLLEKLIQALAPDPTLAAVAGRAADSGMGRWTLEEAVRLGVPAPTIAAALQARLRSQQSDSPTMKSIAALRGVIGGHPVPKSDGGE